MPIAVGAAPGAEPARIPAATRRAAALTRQRPPPTSPVLPRAQVAELVDAPASGAGARKGVEVRVLSWAPLSRSEEKAGSRASPQRTAENRPPRRMPAQSWSPKVASAPLSSLPRAALSTGPLAADE